MKTRVITVENNFRFKQGELYISTTGTIVLCTKFTEYKDFVGVCLKIGERDNSGWKVGEYWEKCNGATFIPFKGTLELTGE